MSDHTARILLILFSLFSFESIRSQKVIFPEASGFRGRFINYKITDPGADITTTCLYFDRKGFLWMGTVWELYRFDGLEYKPFYTNKSDSTGLAGNYITDIYEDNSCKLWISTMGALNYLDQKTWTFDHYSPDTSDYLKTCNIIYYMYEDSRELIWLVTGADIYTFNKTSYTFKKYQIDSLSYLYESYPMNRPGRILEDSKGRIWITTGYGLYMYDQSVDSLVAFRNIKDDELSLANNLITNIKEDSRGIIWCSTAGGLHKISDPQKGVFEKLELGVENKYTTRFDSIFVLLPDSKGNIWAFGNGTVSCHNPGTGETQNYIITPPDYFFGGGRETDQANYRYAFEDKTGEIWFLYSFNGLMYRMNPLTGKTVLYQVPNYAVFSCIMDDNNFFWFGCVSTNTWRLMYEDIEYGSIYMAENSPSIYMEKADLTVESDSLIYLALSSGVYTTENISMNAEFSLKPFYFPDGTKFATSVYKDRSGDIWFGRLPGMISVYNKSSTGFRTFILPSDQTGPVKKIHRDINGDLWMKTLFAIYKMEAGKNEIIQFFSGDKDLDIAITRGITDICFDSNSKIWIAPLYYSSGIFLYDIYSKKVRFFGQGSGLDFTYGDYCSRIFEDSEGRIWLLFSSNGLFLYDREEDRFNKINLKADPGGRPDYLDINVERNERIVISYEGGFVFYDLLTQECKTIRFPQSLQFNHFYHPKNGDLFYITGNHLVVFPDTIPGNKKPPVVYITSLQINNQDYNSLHPESEEIAFVKRIHLSHRQNSLRFNFTGLNFLEGDLCRYSYFMNGIDNDTITVSSDTRYAEYKKMRPGYYTFWVTGSNNNGIWNTEGKTLEIRIFHPFYSSVPAIIFYFLLIFFSVILVIRIRLRHLQSEKVNLEKVVAMRTSELEEKNRQIVDMDRIKTKFFTEISHEIRTPLSLIIGPVENLISENAGKVEERSMKWMEVIRRNGARLTRLVNQLLDISRLDAGKMRLALSESDIFKCIRVIAHGFLSMAETRKIRLIVQVPDEPFPVLFDRDKVEKIVSNLMTNAFKFTAPGGMVIFNSKISRSEYGNDSALLTLSVRDTGTGITKEHLEKIFDRFYRVEGQWEKDGGGTGIGLSLVNEFVKLMHGEIKVESEPGAGSLFIVSIPLGKNHLEKDEFVLADISDEEEIEFTGEQFALTGPIDMNEEKSADRQQVLIIEDNEDLRTYLRENLTGQYTVYEAVNGRSGLEIATSKIPDIIITDIIMPELHGIDLCSILKKDDRTSHIPILMLTAKTTGEDKIEGLKAGADDYLFKPFDVREVKVRIANLLEQREKLRLKFGMLTGFEHHDYQTDNIDERFMKKVSKIISENIHDFEFDVGTLQEKIGLSRVHLFRKLKAITGLSPSEMIRNHRIRKAASLLKLRTGNVSEIALSVGYTNPSHFAKLFKEFYGVSPKEFISGVNQTKNQTS